MRRLNRIFVGESLSFAYLHPVTTSEPYYDVMASTPTRLTLPMRTFSVLNSVWRGPLLVTGIIMLLFSRGRTVWLNITFHGSEMFP